MNNCLFTEILVGYNYRCDRATAAHLAHNQEGVLGATPGSATI